MVSVLSITQESIRNVCCLVLLLVELLIVDRGWTRPRVLSAADLDVAQREYQ